MVDNHNPIDVARFYFSGKDKTTWAKLKDKLVSKFTELLNLTVDEKTGNTIGDIIKDLIVSGVKALKAILDNKARKNEEIEAIILEKYALQKKFIAESRKIEAETEAVELDSKIKKSGLEFLKEYEALLLTQEGNRVLVISKDIKKLAEDIKIHIDSQGKDL